MTAQRRSENAWPAATLLGRLRPQTRAAMLLLGTRVTFPPDRVILRQGDHGQHAYLLLHGMVKVTIAEGDQVAFLAIRVGGDVIGEMAALEQRPRSASVMTTVATSARSVQLPQLKAFTQEHPDAALELMRMMSERLRWANSRRVDLTTRPAPTRLGRILIEVARTYGRPADDGWELGVPLTQAELASLAGLSLRTAEKVLHEMEQAGFVTRGYRRTVITDLDGLRRMADLAEIPH